MLKISVEYLLLFVVIICLVYYLTGSCGCGFSIGGLKDCPKGEEALVTACDLHYENCDKIYSHNWTDGKYHTCTKGGLADLYRCIPSEPCGAHTYHPPLPPQPPPPPPAPPSPPTSPTCELQDDGMSGWYDDSGRQGPGRSRWPPSNGCVCPDGTVPRQHKVLPYTWHCAPPPLTPTPPMCEPGWYDDSGQTRWPRSNGCECRDGTVLTQHTKLENVWQCALPPLIPGPTLGNCECKERLENGPLCADSYGVQWNTLCTDQTNEESCNTAGSDTCRWIPKCDCSKSISQDWCADSIEHQSNQPRILCTNQTTEGSCGTAGAAAGIGINTCKWNKKK